MTGFISTGRFLAVLDANILYSVVLTDFFMRCAAKDFFRPVWSDDIHDEWSSALIKEKPGIPLEKIERRKIKIDEFMPHACIQGYESLVSGLSLPDPDDRHVLALAIRAGAELIITRNIRDFPQKHLEPYDVCAIEPDEFACNLFEHNQALIHSLLREQHADLKNPSIEWEEFLIRLRESGLENLVRTMLGNGK